MPNFHDKMAEQSQPTGGGMQRMLADGSESLAELRDFMGQLRGKGPQEVLGDVASSGLVRATLVSTCGFAVVLVTLSVGTFYWNQAFAEKPVVSKPAPAETAAASPKTPATPQGTEASDSGAGATTSSGDTTLNNLGIGKAKTADPDDNPLENSLDNLLDGAK